MWNVDCYRLKTEGRIVKTVKTLDEARAYAIHHPVRFGYVIIRDSVQEEAYEVEHISSGMHSLFKQYEELVG